MSAVVEPKAEAKKAESVTADDVQVVIDEHVNVLGLLKVCARAAHALEGECEDDAGSDIEASLEIAIGRMDWIYGELYALQQRLKEGRA